MNSNDVLEHPRDFAQRDILRKAHSLAVRKIHRHFPESSRLTRSSEDGGVALSIRFRSTESRGPVAPRRLFLMTSDASSELELVECGLCAPEDWLPVLNDPLAYEYRIAPHPFTLGAAIEFHRRKVSAWKERSELVYGIRSAGDCVGIISLHSLDWRHMCAQVFYWVQASSRKQGLARRALTAVSRIAFEDLGLNRMEALLRSDNDPSRAVLERCGFVFEATLIEKFINNNRTYDGLQFRMTRTDYSSQS